MEELKEKIEEYKEKKKRRTERKAKWENWVKTQVGHYFLELSII